MIADRAAAKMTPGGVLVRWRDVRAGEGVAVTGLADRNSMSALAVMRSEDRFLSRPDLASRHRFASTADCCDYLESLLAASADSVAAIEPDGTIGFITARLRSSFDEADPAQLVGRPWLSIWPDGCCDKLRHSLDRALAGSSTRCEVDCLDLEGRRRWWEIRLSPVKSPVSSGACRSPATTVVAVARDVTDHHEAVTKAGMLGRELHHRVLNMMSMVQAIVRIAATTSNDSATFIESIESRVHAMARTHELLCEGTDGEVDVGDLLRSELLPFERDNAIRMSGSPVQIREPRASAIGLALHELTANAVKYGCLSAAAGQLSVSWEVRDAGDLLQLTWHEESDSAVVIGGRSGFGSLLLDQLLADQLNVTREWQATGLLATITVDLRLPPPPAGMD